jgi:hypothetical protein
MLEPVRSAVVLNTRGEEFSLNVERLNSPGQLAKPLSDFSILRRSRETVRLHGAHTSPISDVIGNPGFIHESIVTGPPLTGSFERLKKFS